MLVFFFFKQNTSDGMRISDWSSDVCSSDLQVECVLAITTLKQELRGVMQRCVRLIVQCIDPCPPDQQPLDQCVEAQRARHHQRSNPAGQRLIDPRAASEQGLHDIGLAHAHRGRQRRRSEEHTSELQSLMGISYAVFCLKKKTTHKNKRPHPLDNSPTE